MVQLFFNDQYSLLTISSGSLLNYTNLDRVRLPCVSGLEVPHYRHGIPLPRPLETLVLLLLLLLLLGDVISSRHISRAWQCSMHMQQLRRKGRTVDVPRAAFWHHHERASYIQAQETRLHDSQRGLGGSLQGTEPESIAILLNITIKIKRRILLGAVCEQQRSKMHYIIGLSL